MSFNDLDKMNDRNTPLLAGDSVTEYGANTPKRQMKQSSSKKSVMIQDHNENLRMPAAQETPAGADASVNISRL